MKRSSFNVLFFLKKTKLLKNGEASVCMRITVDGTRVENNIRKSIDPSLWSQAKESARGKSRKSCDLNAYIENAKIKLHQIFCELEEQNQPEKQRNVFSDERINYYWEAKTVKDFFQRVLQRMEDDLGKTEVSHILH